MDSPEPDPANPFPAVKNPLDQNRKNQVQLELVTNNQSKAATIEKVSDLQGLPRLRLKCLNNSGFVLVYIDGRYSNSDGNNQEGGECECAHKDSFE